jgi:hypothetical protein
MAKKEKEKVKYYKNTQSKVMVTVGADQILPTPYKEISEKEFIKATKPSKKTATATHSNKPADVKPAGNAPEPVDTDVEFAEPGTDDLAGWKKYALTIKGIKEADVKDLEKVTEIKELIKLAK